MMKNTLLVGVIILSLFLSSNFAVAHCDTADGPVIKAAKDAIEKRNVNLILMWVQPEYESEIRTAFQKTMFVRQLNPEAKELADKNLFETLVRLHRASEGAPFTGLKTQELTPEIILADKAVEAESADELINFFKDSIETGIKVQFKKVKDSKGFDSDNVGAGREYANAYVEFVGYVESLQETIKNLQKKHHGEGLSSTTVSSEEKPKAVEKEQNSADGELRGQLSFAWALVATLAIIIIVLAIAYAMPKSGRM